MVGAIRYALSIRKLLRSNGCYVNRPAVGGYEFAALLGEFVTFPCAGGSDLSAAGGRRSEGSEWLKLLYACHRQAWKS